MPMLGREKCQQMDGQKRAVTNNILMGPAKVLFYPKSTDIFIFLQKHDVGSHYKRLAKAFLKSTHNVCFCEEMRKIAYKVGGLKVSINKKR